VHVRRAGAAVVIQRIKEGDTMMRTNVVIPRFVTWLVCGSACLAAAIGVGCAVETTPLADDLGEEVEFRADGCGGGRMLGPVKEKCTYKINQGNAVAMKGTCLSDSQLECNYGYTGCTFSAYSKSGCLDKKPPCPAAPKVAPITLTHIFPITGDDVICDPDDQGAEAKRLRCRSYWEDGIHIIGGKGVETIMDEACAANTAPDVDRTVQCCVNKPSANASSDGDSGEGCEGGSWIPDDDGATSWSDWTTSDEGGGASGDPEASTSGDPGNASSGGSGDGGVGVGDGCPPGTSWECSLGDVDGLLTCACIMQAL
jgi:hypothetical protein